jgi:hypothetical protein
MKDGAMIARSFVADDCTLRNELRIDRSASAASSIVRSAGSQPASRGTMTVIPQIATSANAPRGDGKTLIQTAPQPGSTLRLTCPERANGTPAGTNAQVIDSNKVPAMSEIGSSVKVSRLCTRQLTNVAG